MRGRIPVGWIPALTSGVGDGNGGGDWPPSARQGWRRSVGKSKGPMYEAISSSIGHGRERCGLSGLARIGRRGTGRPDAARVRHAVVPEPNCRCAQIQPLTRRPDTSATTSRRWCSNPRPGIGQRHHLHGHAAEGPAAAAERPGRNGTTWNFQLRPTFWFGLTLCDTESAPEFTKTCTPDSDRNDLEGTNPQGRELHRQAPRQRLHGAAVLRARLGPAVRGLRLHRDSVLRGDDDRQLSSNQNTGVDNNAAMQQLHPRWGWSRSTGPTSPRAGMSQAPANPLFTGTFDDPNFDAVNPDVHKDLFMNPGDPIRMHMHDTPAGFRVDLFDLSTGQSGSMTASMANGFGHILYQPNSSTCHVEPYAFHPEYSTGIPRGNTWSAHTYNVAASDEIGHFENCWRSTQMATARTPAATTPTLDQDDTFCLPAADSTLVPIDGCFVRRRGLRRAVLPLDWPGTNPNPFIDQTAAPDADGVHQRDHQQRHDDYSTIAFEADLPRIEAEDSQFNPPFCDRTTGANCVNPPAGAQFYPLLHDGDAQHGGCVWQQGGHAHPRDDEQLRGELHDGVRAAAADGVSPEPGSRRSSAIRQLQQRRHAQSLPCLPLWRTTLT